MSPEQAMGKELDARTDIFSFGVVLYEMTTGSLPFRGDTSALIFKAILDAPPVAPVRLNPEVPQKLEEIINKTLEKDRTLRYQSAAELRTDLARLKRDLDSGRSSAAQVPAASSSSIAVAPQGKSRKLVVAGIAFVLLAAALASLYFVRGGAASRTRSIAVLPFLNATSDPNNEYLRDGLTESLIGTLSQLPGLKVMARSTVFRFKKNQDDLQQIGKTLQVGAILTGRITQRGDELDIHAELVNPTDGTQIWGSQYKRKLSEMTQVQNDVARDISTALHLELSGDSRQRLTHVATTNTEAYRLYLEGRQLWYGRTPEGLQKSIAVFQQAIAADPNYALAYAGLADSYNVAPSYLPITSREALLTSEEAARKAVELDPALPEAHASLGAVLAFSRRPQDAEREFKRAIELSANDSNAHYFYGLSVLLPQKRFAEAEREFKTALSLDPLSGIIGTNYAMLLMMDHRYNESLEQYQKVLARDPNFNPAHYKLSQLLATMGRYGEAAIELSKTRDHMPISTPDAKGYLEMSRKITSSDGMMSVAAAYALLGDKDNALKYLEQSIDRDDQVVTFGVRYPAFDPMRSDPRFVALMKKLGLPE